MNQYLDKSTLERLCLTEETLKNFSFKHFQEEIYSLQEKKLVQNKFKNGDTLYHRLVSARQLEIDLKVKCIFILSDAGLDINEQDNVNRRTCLHLAVIEGQVKVVEALLRNGADLTITDQFDLCAYNYARRLATAESNSTNNDTENDLKRKDLSKNIISVMQRFYPTYWVGIDEQNMNTIRRLVNSWCKYVNVKKNGKTIMEYAREKHFTEALSLFQSLETQMELCFAVLACNVNKVRDIIANQGSKLRMNFKNMSDKNATIKYYALHYNNKELLRALLDYNNGKPGNSNSFLSECILDEHELDFPIYFAALSLKLDKECLKVITPKFNSSTTNLNSKPNQHINHRRFQLDISHLMYKGMSLLRYAIEIMLDLNTLRELMSDQYCSRELITLRDPDYLTCKELAIKNQLDDYAKLIDEITIDYILNSKSMRMQLALNGYDFENSELKIDEENLKDYAKRNDLKEVCIFLDNVTMYQKQISDFHINVERNEYYDVKASCHLSDKNFALSNNYDSLFKLEDVFLTNLVYSKKIGESQSTLHKAVLHGYYEVLNVLLENLITADDDGDEHQQQKQYEQFSHIFRLEDIRDHCYRTPTHYAYGLDDNRRIAQLVSQFGFSENVFDKDGITPLDFQERLISQEVKNLLGMHARKEFTLQEPNPWSWRVWTEIQREKDSTRPLVSCAHDNPFLNTFLLRGGHHHHHHSHNCGNNADDDLSTSCKIS